MPLTEEQRRQMEENRRRAQEKRQQQLPPKNSSNQITISNDQFQVTPHNLSMDIRQHNDLQNSFNQSTSISGKVVSSGSSGDATVLTDSEKRFRMEENRKKALEKRKNIALASSINGSTSDLEKKIRMEENRKKALALRESRSVSNNNSDETTSRTSCNEQPSSDVEKKIRIEENRKRALEKLQRSKQSQEIPSQISTPINTTPVNPDAENSDSAKRRRMEENRQKALEIRNSKKEMDNQTPSPAASVDQQQPGLGTKSFYGSNIDPKVRMEENRRKALELRQSKQKQDQPTNVTQQFSKMETTSTSMTQPSDLPCSSMSNEKVVGKCILISRERFSVDIKLKTTYFKSVVDLFKECKTGAYDFKKRIWHFQLSEHDDVMKKVRPIQKSHNIHFEALPRWIVSTFKNFSSKLPKEEDVNFSLVEETIANALMPFQREGVIYALQRKGRVFLADDMGLGKTIQALGIASAYKNEWPLLIVCPSSVRFTWRSAVVRWIPTVPEEEVVVITNGKEDICGLVIIISYELLSKKQYDFVNLNPQVAILDESHMIKSEKSARTVAVTAVLKETKRLVLLSGTPCLSRPIELFSQISLLTDKAIFKNCWEFGMRYCDGKTKSLGTKSFTDFSGSSNMDELNILMRERFMIRRLKSEVLTQLPTKQRQMIILDPNLVQSKSRVMKEHIRSFQRQGSNQKDRKAELFEWFHSTAAAKSRAVQDYICDLVDNDRKFICFAHHNVMMNDIASALDKTKVEYIRIDGTTSSETRKYLCDAFQTNDNFRVALLSIKACNTGLTLTAAQLVVFAELYWNPGDLTQAEDRAHRIGQTDSVTIQYLVATGTADDELWPMLQRKLNVLQQAGLSKDNFSAADSHTVTSASSSKNNQKITDYFSTSLTEEDLEALNDDNFR